MSHTYKDTPLQYIQPESYWKYDGERRKQKRNWEDLGSHWGSTPSWWTRLMMNRPQRRKGKVWESVIKHVPIETLEDADPPRVGNKPHNYYY